MLTQVGVADNLVKLSEGTIAVSIECEGCSVVEFFGFVKAYLGDKTPVSAVTLLLTVPDDPTRLCDEVRY